MTEALKLPPKVIESGWKDGIDFELHKNDSKCENQNKAECEAVFPSKVEKATAEQAKSRKIGIGRIAIFSRGDKLVA